MRCHHRAGASRADTALVLWAAVLWLWAGAAEAQPSRSGRLGFNWVRMVGAESCVSSTDLMQGIEKLADNRKLFVPASEALLSLDGYVKPVDEPRGWEVTFEISDAQGKVLGRTFKVLPGDDCSLVADAMAFMVDLRVKPDGTLAPPGWLSPEAQQALEEAMRGWDGHPQVVVQPHDPAPIDLDGLGDGKQGDKPVEHPLQRSKKPPPPPPSAPQGEPALFDAGVAVALGELPGLALGVGVHGTLPTGFGWPIELGFSSFPGRKATSTNGSASVELQQGSVAICPLHLVRVLMLCGGAAYGRQNVGPNLVNVGAKTGRNDPSSQPAVDALGFGALELNLAGPVFLSARLVFIVPLLRHEYVYERLRGNAVRLFRMAPIAGRIDVGLGFSL